METSYSEFEESNASGYVPPDLDSPPSSIPLKPIESRYILIRTLGHGSFGTVTLAKSQFNVNSLLKDFNNAELTLMCQDNLFPPNKVTQCQRLVAIKTMVTRLKTLHDYKKVREIKFILKMAPNPHLIQIFEIFIDKKNYQLHIVMEYMEQNLYQMMKHRKNKVFSYPSLKSILAQLLVAIKHIHSYNFFHRDIKPENILVTPSSLYFDKQYLKTGDYKDNYVIKLADFGLARNIFNCNSYTPYVSTRWYRSPEILLRNGFYSTPLDIWAFGCVAFELTTFRPLFPGNDELDQVWRILEVLGTPYKSPEYRQFNSEPFGGFWNDSLLLLNKLNLTLPFAEGVSMEKILPNPQLKDLTEVIKQCLKWDPNERICASALKDFKFFQDTIIQKEPLRKNNNEISDIQQAMLFAGLNSKSFISRGKNLKINVENEDLEDKKQSNSSVKNHLYAKLQKRQNSNWQSSSTHPSNIIASENTRGEKLTVNEFLKEYKRGDVNNPLGITKEREVPLTDAYIENTNLTLIKNDETYEDLDVDIDEIYDSDEFYENGYRDFLDKNEIYDTKEEEEKEIRNGLSKKIEQNLKNYSIPREISDENDSSILKKSFDRTSCSNLFTLGKNTDSELQNLNIKIQQEQLNNFSDTFPSNLEKISNDEINIESMYLDMLNTNGSNDTNNCNKIGSNSYILSKNIQCEIQHRHDNLLDNSFDSSMNITTRKYLSENLKGENFFNISRNNILNNIEIEQDKSHEEKSGSQLPGNLTF